MKFSEENKVVLEDLEYDVAPGGCCEPVLHRALVHAVIILVVGEEEAQ